jgi:hypothetical protein
MSTTSTDSPGHIILLQTPAVHICSSSSADKQHSIANSKGLTCCMHMQQQRRQATQHSQQQGPHLLEQVDGHGVASVLSANTQLDVGARGASTLHRNLDQLAHTDCVDGLEGVERQQAVLGVELQELGLRIVTADAKGLQNRKRKYRRCVSAMQRFLYKAAGCTAGAPYQQLRIQGADCHANYGHHASTNARGWQDAQH